MAGLKEIKRRLKSVNNTKKITYAMKLVSAAKLRKAQESVTSSRHYADALSDLLHLILDENRGNTLAHPILTPRERVKRVRLLVIGGNRGLCGGYNVNINRAVVNFYQEMKERDDAPEVSSAVFGRKPAEFFRRTGRPYEEAHETLSEDATLWPAEEWSTTLLRDFLSGAVDEAYVLFTRFKSAISVSVMWEKLLPMERGMLHTRPALASASHKGDILFEPSSERVFAELLPRILGARLRQACLDAKASEHGSRMTAMDAATKNASELVSKLRLLRNKLRQAGITADLLDIIGGAEALK